MFNLTRRSFLAVSAGASLFPWSRLACSRDSGAHERLWYLRPAARWDDALPIGNGRLGAMVFGRVAQERLQLNEDTLWAGSPYVPDNPDALAAIPEVHKLLLAERYQEAVDLTSAKVMAKPLRQMPYGTAGDLFLNFQDAQAPTSYQRALDLTTAISTTEYRTKAGSFTREAFASAPHQVIVLQLQAPKGKLNFDIGYRGPREVQYTPPNYQGSATVLAENESIDWLMTEAAGATGAEVRVRGDGSACLLITGRNAAGPTTPAGLTYALRVRIVTDGRVVEQDGRMSVQGARTATLLIAAATSYVNYHDVTGDPIAIVRRQTDSAAKEPYAKLKQAHVSEYRSLYTTASLQLPVTASADKPTNVRIAEGETSDDPALAVLYFQFARYLLISSSRAGTQPANLQGIWNEGINPPWGSKYTININTEMNYWPADPAGLGVCVEPLLRMVEDLAVTGARTAKTMYGVRGWVTHHNTDLWRAAAPIDKPSSGMWSCGGAWLCNTLWDHYDYSRDEQTLRRLYPLLRGASLFFLDTMIEDPKGRGLVTSPSSSPENAHPFGTSLCIGPSMDRQIIRDLFAHTIEAGRTLKVDEELLAQIATTARRIAPDVIGKNGQLQEWLEDWDDRAPDQHHRHVSHLYAVYPSSQLNVRDTPAFIAAAKKSLRDRGDLATGWGTAWRLCLWARMGEGDHAHSILKALVGPKRTYPNMFDAHPPFQIDGNFGGAAGIMEMIVQSWGDEIRLLPALPSAWPEGEVRGIRARGAISIDMRWRAHKVASLVLAGPANKSLTLRYGDTSRSVVLDARGRFRM
jgi:alpha-L-fucosidase 2